MFDAASSSRRLLLLCIVTTVVPVICLSWLAWQVVKEDRQRNWSPVRDRREQAAGLAVNALQGLIAQAEERLGPFGTLRESESLGPLVDGLSFVVLPRTRPGPSRGEAYTGAKPLYLPEGYSSGFIDTGSAEGRLLLETLSRADEREFTYNDLTGALTILQTMVVGHSPRVRANALLRVARIQRKLGRTENALQAYAALRTLGHTNVGTLPAALVAAKGCALIYGETGRQADLQREASDIHYGLVNSRWRLTRGDFHHAYEQSREWLIGERPPLDPERVAVAEALDTLWREGQSHWLRAGVERRRQIVWVNSVPVFVVAEFAPGRVKALFMTPRYLERVWRRDLRSTVQGGAIQFVLTDAHDRPVLGTLTGPLSRRSVRSGAAAQLPWTVYAITVGDDSILGVTTQTKLVLSGIALMGLFSIAGAYVINRAMLRELRVAQVQAEFVAAVSHEFRTPLTTIRQFSEMLVKGRVSSDERRHLFYETLLRESERLQRLVEGLLNFGSMQAGELQYRFEIIELEPFIRDVVADFERSIQGRGYSIELKGHDGITPVRADRDLLARVFWNLLDNAVKYSPDDRTLRVELTPGGHRIAVSVRDGGVGVTVSEQQAIFRKFVRGTAARTASVQGTGVGLAMARQIAEVHGGQITVVSKPGQGSLFTVTLPIAKP